MLANKLDIPYSITILALLDEVCLSTTALHVHFLNHVEIDRFLMHTTARCALYREVPVSLQRNVDRG